MSTLPYTISVPLDGTVTFPPEFRNMEIIVLKKTPPLPENNDHWTKPKTLDELIQEQGGPKPMLDPDSFFGGLSFLWDSQEEMEEFLRRRKE